MTALNTGTRLVRLARTFRLHSCVLAAPTMLLSGCGGSEARYARHLERGAHYLDEGNLDKAGVEFRNAAQIKPKESDPLYFNGRVAEARGNLRDAVSLYQAAVEVNSGTVGARAHLGKLLVFAGAAQRALDTVTPALSSHLDDPDLLAVRAAARHQLKQNDAARADAERAAQLAPTNENAIAVLAALYADAKDYPKAVALVSGAVNRSPASVDLREVLTNLYLATAQPDKAEEQMRKIIELEPAVLAPRAQLAQYLARAHNLDGAQKVLEDAVQSFSRNKDRQNADAAKLLLVDFVVSERSREQGEKTLRDFVEQDPDNLDLRLGLGALLQRTGAATEAIASYREVIKKDGTGAKALLARDRIAAMEMSAGHAEAARKLLSEVLKTNPRDDDALLLRATMELRENNAADAIGDLRAVIRNQPNSVQLKQMLASAYVAKGEPALAEETLRAALQSNPKDASIRIGLAQLLARTERIPQGVALLEETVSQIPDSIPTREALIRAYVANRNLPAARAAAEELKTRQPKEPAGYYLAGLIASEEKHPQESERNLEHALELLPRDVSVLTALARVEMSLGAYDKAVDRVQTALAADPNNVQLLNLLGGLFLEKKDFTRAGEAFTHASARDPRQWQTHRNLAAVKVAINDINGAAGEFQAALKIAPAEPQLVADAAAFYERHGRVDDAIVGYEALYKDNPRTQQFAANNLAILLVTYKTDRASLDRARDLTSSFTSSQNSSLLDTVGWVRFKRGEYKEALPVLERALAGAPDSKVIRYHLGMNELQLGLRDRARTNLEIALAGSESFSGADDARLALTSLEAGAG